MWSCAPCVDTTVASFHKIGLPLEVYSTANFPPSPDADATWYHCSPSIARSIWHHHTCSPCMPRCTWIALFPKAHHLSPEVYGVQLTFFPANRLKSTVPLVSPYKNKQQQKKTDAYMYACLSLMPILVLHPAQNFTFIS